MNMEEEVVTWNLKGPKRMRKRKELNKLVRNDIRYKSVFKKNSAVDMFNLNSGASRLLNKSNESSTDNDDYFFSANKAFIRERKRKNCCKLIQITIGGSLITFMMIVGVVLVFSYSKFNEALTDLKQEFESHKEQNLMTFTQVKQQLKKYDAIFKNDLLNESVKGPKKRLKRSIENMDISNQLNGFLIGWLFNNSKIFESNYESKTLMNSILNDYTNGDDLNFKKYNELIHEFLKTNISSKSLPVSSFKKSIYNDVEIIYIKPILEALTKCHCPLANLKTMNSTVN